MHLVLTTTLIRYYRLQKKYASHQFDQTGFDLDWFGFDLGSLCFLARPVVQKLGVHVLQIISMFSNNTRGGETESSLYHAHIVVRGIIANNLLARVS